MDKMRMESPDLTQRNIEAIGALFPNCITETRGADGSIRRAINFDTLRQMLTADVSVGDEAFEFTWVGKRSAMVEASRIIRKTLRPVMADSRDWDTTENIYIEGDNLDALKLLQESYLGRVKMIYIDPPYNTGHDFVYRDHFTRTQAEEESLMGMIDEDTEYRLFENTETNGRFHSDWCSMIFSRLMLARNLLTEDGFIAISIGEEEAANLRCICNEVFGAANFRNIIAVRRYDKNINLQFADNGLATMNVGLEYILIYSKNPHSKMQAVYRATTEERGQTGYWKGFWNNADRPTMRYNILGVIPQDGQWKWKKEVADEAVANYQEYEAHFADRMTLEEYWDSTGRSKRFIRRKSSGSGKNMGVEHWVAPADGILRNSNWSDLLVSKPAGMGIPFDSPKNIDMLRELIKLFNVSSGDIVLDFFSGSASMAHAVLQQNAEDGSNRHFIMVQLPEECEEKSDAYLAGYRTICEIGKERIRRAGDKLKAEMGLTVQSLDIGFRVLRIDDTNMKPVYYGAGEYTQDLLSGLESNIRDDRTDLDLLFGCLLEWGLPLSLPYSSEKLSGCTVHTYNDGDLMACFDENVPESVIREIASRHPLRVVFRDSSFASSPERINVEEIFKLLSPNTSVKVL